MRLEFPLFQVHVDKNAMVMHSLLPQLTSTPFTSGEQMTDTEKGT